MTAAVAPDLLRPLGRELARVLVPHLAARARVLGRELRRADVREVVVRDESARLGLGLGLVAAACGIEVLRGRREPRALCSLLELLAEARGEPLDARWNELPALSSCAGAGWEAPVLVGWAWLAGARAGRARDWSQERGPDRWWFRVAHGRLPDPVGETPWSWRREGTRLALGLPRAWLAAR